jgi:UDP-N-acetylglucosamine diphosphorylase/glucosamine-1-phosphate N-acetyltransferase
MVNSTPSIQSPRAPNPVKLVYEEFSPSMYTGKPLKTPELAWMPERTSIMRVCLFEDAGVANLEPLTLTRPVFELLCGATSLSCKQQLFFAGNEVGVLIRPFLADLNRLEHPETPVNDEPWVRSGPIIFVNGRWLPPLENTDISNPCLAWVGDQVAYASLPAELAAEFSLDNFEDLLDTWKQKLPYRPAGGCLINFPWDIVEQNSRQLCQDTERLDRSSEQLAPDVNFAIVGPKVRLHVDSTAQIDPMVVVDTKRGPVVIDRKAVVHAFSRLEGPCYIGPHSHVLGAKIRSGTTLGPECRIGGEVEASIVHGHSNKYHDGFLGHSYVGEWVNIGAGTQNSDLRNDYAEVTVQVNGRLLSTGLTKVGCFIGDHTKIGLGALINTGASMGAFCNLLPSGGLLPRFIPSFCSWWQGNLKANDNWRQLLDTASVMMGRRDRSFTEAHATLYSDLFDQTALERQRTLQVAQQRAWRRSA